MYDPMDDKSDVTKINLKPEEREWPTDQIIRLVEEYRSRPLLWNPNNEMFRVQSAKYDAWMSMARKFNCEVGFLRKKFNSIFASHRREKTKVRYGTRSFWFLYDHLCFLPSHIPNVPQTNKTRSDDENEEREFDAAPENSESDPENILHEEVMIKEEPMEAESTQKKPLPRRRPPPKRPPPKSAPTKITKPSRIASHFVTPPARPEVIKVVKPASSTKDECDSFGEYIAVSLRKHDERTRSMIKQAINNILFEQEMKKYSTNQYVDDVEIEQNPLLCEDDGEEEIIK